jgi:hypothetical protein
MRWYLEKQVGVGLDYAGQQEPKGPLALEGVRVDVPARWWASEACADVPVRVSGG